MNGLRLDAPLLGYQHPHSATSKPPLTEQINQPLALLDFIQKLTWTSATAARDAPTFEEHRHKTRRTVEHDKQSRTRAIIDHMDDETFKRGKTRNLGRVG